MNTNPNTQLPDEIWIMPADKITFLKEVVAKLKASNQSDYKTGEFDSFNHKQEGRYKAYEEVLQWLNLDAEYATKLHQAQQDIVDLKRWKEEAKVVLNPIYNYGQSKGANIPLGQSITETVLDRCIQFDQARTLLHEVLVMNEMWGDLPSEYINKVKTFLDGTK